MTRCAIAILLLFTAMLAAQNVAPVPSVAPAPEKKHELVIPPEALRVDVAPSNVKPPTTPIEFQSCVTSECHAGVKKHRVLHGPVNVDACDACHKLADAAKHKFELKRPKQQLCGFCHITDTQTPRFVHKPLTTGDCMGCHDPHGGYDARFLKSRTMGPMCIVCHADQDFSKFKFIHGPASSGDCGGCHKPHSADNEKLLVRTGRDLCLGCHKEMRQQLAVVPIKHEPVEKGCITCHDPHASNFRMVTKAPPLQLCAGECHDNIRTAVTQAKFKHDAVTEEGGCANCHTPHGGELAFLMKDRPVNVCLKCHDKSINNKDGQQIVPAMNNLINPDLYKHGPVKDGSCGGCHEVHGSNHTRLLAGAYPDKFYQAFNVDKYGLCFSCHDKNLVLEPKVDHLTRFRDGDKNLHYVHVNKIKMGRTCRACHDTHTSDHEHIIRDSVPYGKSNWQLPIRYTPTPTGGSCASGCHQRLRYDREQPANDHYQPPDESDDKSKTKPPPSDPYLKPRDTSDAPASSQARVDAPAEPGVTP